MKHVLTGFILAIALLQAPAFAAQWSGYVSGQYRGFFEDPADPRQHNNYLSVAATTALIPYFSTASISMMITAPTAISASCRGPACSMPSR
jgi:hypothetical protein